MYFLYFLIFQCLADISSLAKQLNLIQGHAIHFKLHPLGSYFDFWQTSPAKASSLTGLCGSWRISTTFLTCSPITIAITRLLLLLLLLLLFINTMTQSNFVKCAPGERHGGGRQRVPLHRDRDIILLLIIFIITYIYIYIYVCMYICVSFFPSLSLCVYIYIYIHTYRYPLETTSKTERKQHLSTPGQPAVLQPLGNILAHHLARSNLALTLVWMFSWHLVLKPRTLAAGR